MKKALHSLGKIWVTAGLVALVYLWLAPNHNAQLKDSQQNLKRFVPVITAEANAQKNMDFNAAIPVPTEATPQPVLNPETKSSAQTALIAATHPSQATHPAPAAAASPKATLAPKATPKPDNPCASGSYNQQFLCLLNDFRISQGENKLSYDASLNSVALTYSNWMLSTGIFSHTGQNGSHFFDRCQNAGTRCLAENLAENAGSAQNLFDLWKASAEHRANLLGPYTTIGLGVSGNYTTALFN
jgi:uncharacterized protein YkwD